MRTNHTERTNLQKSSGVRYRQFSGTELQTVLSNLFIIPDVSHLRYQGGYL